MSTPKLDNLRGSPAVTAGGTTMRAIVQDRYGPESADVLRLAEIDRPTISDDEVLVRVHAAGVDRGTWHIMAGLPYPIRLAGYGLRAPKDRVRGREVAGHVEAVGKAVTTLHVGDEVFGIAEGSFAEYAPARADKLARKPANLTFEQAAAAPISALTALQGIRDRGHVKPGQQVLIIGASGGVGTFAVQIAKSFGATVTGVCSRRNVDLVRSVGADEVIDYTQEDFTHGGQRYDVMLDLVGSRSLSDCRRALTPRGTYVLVGVADMDRWFGVARQIKVLSLSPLVRQRMRVFIVRHNQEDLAVLKQLVEAGKVAPVIDRRYQLSEVPEALRYQGEGHARGKLVIAV